MLNGKTLWPRNLNKSENKVHSTLITMLNEAQCQNVKETEGRPPNMIKLTNKYGVNSHLHIAAIWYPGKESLLNIWHKTWVGPKACHYTEQNEKFLILLEIKPHHSVHGLVPIPTDGTMTAIAYKRLCSMRNTEYFT